MIRKLYIIAIISVVLPALSSCRAISSFLGSDEVVAVVGSDKLLRENIESLIPKGLSSEDSLRLASQYINSWASDRVYLKIAEEQLSKSEKDVTKELERISKELEKNRKFLASLEGKLSNEGFVSRAPEAVVAAEREKAQKTRDLIIQLEQSEAAMKKLQ